MSCGVVSANINAPINWASPVNWLDPLNRGLVAWYLCVPGAMGGKTWQCLNRCPPGTLTNMDPQSDWVSGGRIGGWGNLDFDGSNDTVIIPGNPVTGLDRWAFSCWFRLLGGNRMLVTSDSFSATEEGLFFLPASNLINTTSRAWTWVEDLNWHQIVWQKTSSTPTFECWVDAVQLTEVATAGALNVSNTNINISGRSDVGGFAWSGGIDDVRLYNRSLSAFEIKELFCASRLFYPTQLNRVNAGRYLFAAAAAAAAMRGRLSLLGVGR